TPGLCGFGRSLARVQRSELEGPSPRGFRAAGATHRVSEGALRPRQANHSHFGRNAAGHWEATGIRGVSRCAAALRIPRWSRVKPGELGYNGYVSANVCLDTSWGDDSVVRRLLALVPSLFLALGCCSCPESEGSAGSSQSPTTGQSTSTAATTQLPPQSTGASSP